MRLGGIHHAERSLASSSIRLERPGPFDFDEEVIVAPLHLGEAEALDVQIVGQRGEPRSLRDVTHARGQDDQCDKGDQDGRIGSSLLGALGALGRLLRPQGALGLNRLYLGYALMSCYSDPFSSRTRSTARSLALRALGLAVTSASSGSTGRG